MLQHMKKPPSEDGVEPITSAADNELDDGGGEGVERLGGGNTDDDGGDEQGEEEGAAGAVLDLPLGRPFAIAGDCEILPEGGPDNLPGTFATVCCDCGELFKLNLLVESDKKCPGCGAVYTHALVIGRADDQTLAQEFVDEVLVSNGYAPIIARDEEELDDDNADDNEKNKD
jgi:hypothetical protein